MQYYSSIRVCKICRRPNFWVYVFPWLPINNNTLIAKLYFLKIFRICNFLIFLFLFIIYPFTKTVKFWQLLLAVKLYVMSITYIIQAEASMTVLMPCMVDVHACFASGVKAAPRLAAKKTINTLAKFCHNSIKYYFKNINVILAHLKRKKITHIKMCTSCSAVLVLFGQISQLFAKAIRVSHRVDQFRQFSQDIDRQGLMWWQRNVVNINTASFIVDLIICCVLTFRAGLFNISPIGTLVIVGNMAWYSGWAVNSLFSKLIRLKSDLKLFKLFNRNTYAT